MAYPSFLRLILILATVVINITNIWAIKRRKVAHAISIFYVTAIAALASIQLISYLHIFIDSQVTQRNSKKAIVRSPPTLGQVLDLVQLIVQWIFHSAMALTTAHHDRKDPSLAKKIAYLNLGFVNTLCLMSLSIYAGGGYDFKSILYGVTVAIFVCLINPVMAILAIIGILRQIAVLSSSQNGKSVLKPWALLLQGVVYIVIGGGYLGWGGFEWKPAVFGQNLMLFVQWLDSAGFAFLDNTVIGCSYMIIALVSLWLRVRTRTRRDNESNLHERMPLLIE